MNKDMTYVWDRLENGEEVNCYQLIRGDMSAQILNLGGIVYSLKVPDKNGQPVDVMLGFDTAEEYRNSDTYFGAIVGRYANRIANGAYELEGKKYVLERNNGVNNLHSGKNGFHQYLFHGEFDENEPYRLVLTGEDKDMNQGFPGNLKVKITYELMENRGLQITYEAVTDKVTPINMTWHGYFNLDGHEAGNILEHKVCLQATHYTPFADEHMIPSGALMPVEATVFDFLQEKTIGRDINERDPQLEIAGGYDHNFVFEASGKGNALRQVAQVTSDKTGIVMKVVTDRPCMQFYTGNFIVPQKGKGGAHYNHRQGFCMETQTFPNAVNCKAFPEDLLRPGECYKTTTRYYFFQRD